MRSTPYLLAGVILTTAAGGSLMLRSGTTTCMSNPSLKLMLCAGKGGRIYYVSR